MNRRVGVLLSYMLMIFEVISTLLLTPFIIRTLGQAQYGVYKLTAAINAYLLLLDLGVGNAITRYIAKYRASRQVEEERLFLGVATVYYTSIAAIALIVGGVLVAVFPKAFANGLNSEEILLGQRLLAITMVNSAITLGTAAYTNTIVAYEQFWISKGSSIISIILRMGLTYIALRNGLGSIGLVSVNLMMTVLCRGFFVIYVLGKLHLRPKFKGIQSSFVKEIVSYSSLILLQMIATQLNATVDQVLIGATVTASSVIVGVYGVGTQVVQYFQSMGSAFTGVLMPGIVKLVENGASSEQLTDEMIRIGRIILIVLGLIWSGFLVVGQNFIHLWAGAENKEAYAVAIILMTAYLFILIESVGSQILWAKNQHREQAVLKLAIVLANILLTIALIKWKPLIGATIGTFISLMVGDVIVMNVIFAKKIGINVGHYYRSTFSGILPCMCLCIIVGYLISKVVPVSWGGLFVKIGCMTLTYGFSMWIIGMNSYEKSIVINMVHKLNKRKRR